MFRVRNKYNGEICTVYSVCRITAYCTCFLIYTDSNQWKWDKSEFYKPYIEDEEETYE